MVRPFFRSRLRAFQAMLGDTPDPGFIATLEYLENRDLDLSIRIGGLLAFNALMTTIGTHPISASPGAPLSLDAPTQPELTLLSLVGLLPQIWSSILCTAAGRGVRDRGARGGAGRRTRPGSGAKASTPPVRRVHSLDRRTGALPAPVGDRDLHGRGADHRCLGRDPVVQDGLTASR